MKKIISSVLALAFSLGLIACSNPKDSSSVENVPGLTDSGIQKDSSSVENVPELTDSGLTDFSSCDWYDDQTLSILVIGNSFSDDTFEFLWNIATSLGIKNVSLGILYIGGSSLDLHYSNAVNNKASYVYRTNNSGVWFNNQSKTLEHGIKDQKWDFITFQQNSVSATDPTSFSNLNGLMEYVRSICNKEAKFVWNMTWAYAADHVDMYKFNNDPMVMYNLITQNVEQIIIPNDAFCAISPSGTAIQNARSSRFNELVTRDTYHLSSIGRYIVALTFFKTITGAKILDIEYSPTVLTGWKKDICLESAINACKTPFETTQSAY